MKSCRQTSIATLTFLTFSAFLWDSANAAPPKFSGDTDKVELKVHYRGEGTPDGIIFQSLVRRIAVQYQSDPDRTLRKVKREMAIENDDDAFRFIMLLQKEHEKLSKARTHAKHSYVCGARPNRSKEELFGDLDTLTSVKIDLAAAAYDAFSVSLSSNDSTKLHGWIQETKPGFQYFVTSAEQITEKMGVDAKAHYKNQCIKIEQKLERMK